MSGGERYVVTFAPVGGGQWLHAPGIVRLRKLLKAAGRAYGLRVVGVVADQPRAEPPRETTVPIEGATHG